jgi:hypothetical protein
MDKPSLGGVELKIRWAQKHLDAIDATIRSYFAGEPYIRVHEYDLQRSQRLAGIRVTKMPPANLALMIGDYLHNITSALDHLAWQLVLASGCTPTRHTKFPIYKDAGVYKERAGEIVIKPFVTQDIRTLVESTQPYHRGDNARTHPLWIMHCLSNIDKHRTLHPISMWIERGERFTLGARPGTDDIVFFFQGVTNEREMKMQIESALSITILEPTYLLGRPIVRLLSEPLKFVREDMLPRFAPFFN